MQIIKFASISNIVTVLNDNDIKFHWPMFDEHIFQLILFNSHIDTISLTM